MQCARITREPRGDNKDTANASYGKDVSDIGVQRWASKHIYPTVIRQHLNMAAGMGYGSGAALAATTTYGRATPTATPDALGGRGGVRRGARQLAS